MEQQHTATVLRPLCKSTGVSQQLQLETGGFVGAQFFCPYALAGGNQRIRVRVPRRVRENVGEGGILQSLETGHRVGGTYNNITDTTESCRQ